VPLVIAFPTTTEESRPWCLRFDLPRVIPRLLRARALTTARPEK
jgi:hypothetical protein